ncbi:MAG: hypothetical protein ACYC91_11900 [Solirubrobacteraceae bacterium]
MNTTLPRARERSRRLTRLLRMSSAGLVSSGAALIAPPAALAIAPVKIATLPSALTPAANARADVGMVGYYTALYVDSHGTAHVAYVTPDQKQVVTCTIPRGGQSCVGAATLDTDATGQSVAQITSIKYLVDPGGNGLLAVAMYNLSAPGGSTPYSETEIFSTLNGAFAGQRVGAVYDPGPGSGDTIVEPDDSGVEVIGLDEFGPLNCTLGYISPQYYAFESLVRGGQSGGPISLGTEETQPSCSKYGWAPFDLTKLPGGQTAVFGSLYLSSAGPFASPADGIRVAPALGAAFGPWRRLGINGSLAAVNAPAPGGSYVLNVQNSQQFQRGTNAAPMQLASFRGTSLQAPVSIGQASDVVALAGLDWRQLPPISEDANGGDVRIGWLARGTHDGCPAAAGGLASDDTCLMYRLVEPGLRLGPKVVLSVQPSNDGNGNSSTIAGLGPIAADSSGVGWMLVFRGANVPNGQPATLYAQPLVDVAAARGPARVHGGSVSTAISCAGGSGCTVSAQLTVRLRGAKVVRAFTARTVVVGRTSIGLGGGRTKSILVRLNARGRLLLSRQKRLPATLLITEKVGVTRAVVADQRVIFKKR